MKQANHVNQPRPKKAGAEHTPKKRMFLRDGGTTMPFLEGLTENECKIVLNRINTILIELGHKPLKNNRFLITR